MRQAAAKAKPKQRQAARRERSARLGGSGHEMRATDALARRNAHPHRRMPLPYQVRCWDIWVAVALWRHPFHLVG